MYKRFVAYCLLIAFGVLLTPRDFWHECEDHQTELKAHNHSEHKDEHQCEHPDGQEDSEDSYHSDESHDTHFDSKCFACDYDMTAAIKPIAFQFRFVKSVYPISQQVQNHLVELRYVGTDCLRGPPVV